MFFLWKCRREVINGSIKSSIALGVHVLEKFENDTSFFIPHKLADKIILDVYNMKYRKIALEGIPGRNGRQSHELK